MNKKRNKLIKKISNIIGIDGIFFHTGKSLFLIVGAFIIVNKMINFYLNFDSILKESQIFNLAFMLGIASIPIFISWIFLRDIFEMQEKKDE